MGALSWDSTCQLRRRRSTSGRCTVFGGERRSERPLAACANHHRRNGNMLMPYLFIHGGAVRKVVYLATQIASQRWVRLIKDWVAARNHFMLVFEGRVRNR